MNTINKIINSNPVSSLTENSLLGIKEDNNENSLNFEDFLINSVDNLNNKYLELNEAQQLFSQGDIEAHELMSILRETELVLKTATTIRNKMLDAYKEITNMQI